MALSKDDILNAIADMSVMEVVELALHLGTAVLQWFSREIRRHQPLLKRVRNMKNRAIGNKIPWIDQ